MTQVSLVINLAEFVLPLSHVNIFLLFRSSSASSSRSNSLNSCCVCVHGAGEAAAAGTLSY